MDFVFRKQLQFFGGLPAVNNFSKLRSLLLLLHCLLCILKLVEVGGKRVQKLVRDANLVLLELVEATLMHKLDRLFKQVLLVDFDGDTVDTHGSIRLGEGADLGLKIFDVLVCRIDRFRC